jgi:hypothetical protein
VREFFGKRLNERTAGADPSSCPDKRDFRASRAEREREIEKEREK